MIDDKTDSGTAKAGQEEMEPSLCLALQGMLSEEQWYVMRLDKMLRPELYVKESDLN